MKIVITDGFTVNPGDLNWKSIEQFGEVEYHDSSPDSEVVKRCALADIIVSNKTSVTEATINAAKSLKLIAVTATGYNNVAIAAARSKGIPVCNVPEYGTWSVAQHAFALLLELSNHVGMNAASVAAGEWYASAEWCYTKLPIIELKDKVLGIVGFGRIGQQMARLAIAFGMKVLYVNRSPVETDLGQPTNLDHLFSSSDFISLHCPLTTENAGFVNAKLLSRMKPTTFLINTSRGALINDTDLAAALNAHKIAGAALDVLAVEPPKPPHPLIGLSNCIVTPHNAWVSFEARKRIIDITAENIRLFLEGRPQNVVNK